jgi:hypothetical protein
MFRLTRAASRLPSRLPKAARRSYRLEGEAPPPSSLRTNGPQGPNSQPPRRSTILGLLLGSSIAAAGHTMPNEYYQGDVMSYFVAPLAFSLVAPRKALLPFLLYNGAMQAIFSPIIFASAAGIWMSYGARQISISKDELASISDDIYSNMPSVDGTVGNENIVNTINVSRLLWFFAKHKNLISSDAQAGCDVIDRARIDQVIAAKNPLPNAIQSATGEMIPYVSWTEEVVGDQVQYKNSQTGAVQSLHPNFLNATASSTIATLFNMMAPAGANTLAFKDFAYAVYLLVAPIVYLNSKDNVPGIRYEFVPELLFRLADCDKTGIVTKANLEAFAKRINCTIELATSGFEKTKDFERFGSFARGSLRKKNEVYDGPKMAEEWMQKYDRNRRGYLTRDDFASLVADEEGMKDLVNDTVVLWFVGFLVLMAGGGDI